MPDNSNAQRVTDGFLTSFRKAVGGQPWAMPTHSGLQIAHSGQEMDDIGPHVIIETIESAAEIVETCLTFLTFYQTIFWALPPTQPQVVTLAALGGQGIALGETKCLLGH